MSIPQIPAAAKLRADHVEHARARESRELMDAVLERERLLAAQCPELLRTGRHRLVADEHPTFMCGSDPWAGHVRHCVGSWPRATSIGTFEVRCPVFEIPGQRRGSTGRKRLLYRA